MSAMSRINEEMENISFSEHRTKYNWTVKFHIGLHTSSTPITTSGLKNISKSLNGFDSAAINSLNTKSGLYLQRERKCIEMYCY